jgi:hypothetical protein
LAFDPIVDMLVGMKAAPKRAGALLNAALAAIALALGAGTIWRHHHNRPISNPLSLRTDEIKFENVPLDDAIDYFSRVSRLKFRIDLAAIGENNWDPSCKISLHLYDTSVRDALRRTLAMAGNMDFDYDGRTVLVTSDAAIPSIIRVYDVGDLLPPKLVSPSFGSPTGDLWALPNTVPQGGKEPSARDMALANMEMIIQNTVAPDTWALNGRATGELWVVGDHLIIRQSRDGHEKTATLLRLLRAADARRAWDKQATPAAAAGGAK